MDALANLVEWIKLHRQSVLYGMSRREIDELMDALHKANLALSASQKDKNDHE